MASEQRSEAEATYRPIEGMGLLNSASFKTPWASHPRLPISLSREKSYFMDVGGETERSVKVLFFDLRF